jgi:hypothetical protein
MKLGLIFVGINETLGNNFKRCSHWKKEWKIKSMEYFICESCKPKVWLVKQKNMVKWIGEKLKKLKWTLKIMVNKIRLMKWMIKFVDGLKFLLGCKNNWLKKPKPLWRKKFWFKIINDVLITSSDKLHEWTFAIGLFLEIENLLWKSETKYYGGVFFTFIRQRMNGPF